MQQKQQELDRIYDLRAIRVIVEDKTDCYSVLRQVSCALCKLHDCTIIQHGVQVSSMDASMTCTPSESLCRINLTASLCSNRSAAFIRVHVVFEVPCLCQHHSLWQQVLLTHASSFSPHCLESPQFMQSLMVELILLGTAITQLKLDWTVANLIAPGF